MHQLNVKTVFLNGELEEQVFMDLPSCLGSVLGAGKVFKFKNSLYRLKQSLEFGLINSPRLSKGVDIDKVKLIIRYSTSTQQRVR